MNDIELLKAQLTQTNLAYQMAAQMSQFKTGFLARTAHELRSPLSSLISLHQLIISGLCESPEEEREFITQAYEAALRLVELLDKIVNVAKLEYGRTQLEIQSLQLTEVLTQVQDLTYLQAANRNLQLEITLPDESVYVLADLPRFKQVLVTLIDTGISLMEVGKIVVSSQASETEQCVEVNIDLECDPTQWSESTNLLQEVPEPLTPAAVKSFSSQLEFSPGMKLLLSQNLLATMQGELQLLAMAEEEKSDRENFTRLRCVLPLATNIM